MQGLDPIVADKGPLMMCLSPAVYPPKGGYVFSSSIHPVDLTISSFRFFHKKGWNNIALMMGTDATGQEVDTKIDQVMAMPSSGRCTSRRTNTLERPTSALRRRFRRLSPLTRKRF